MSDLISATAADFRSAVEEFEAAWENPNHTRFTLPAVQVNSVLAEKYTTSSPIRLTRHMVWDMEQQKAWDPATFNPYVVSKGKSWGRHRLRDGSERFFRSSEQLDWITEERGTVLEEVLVDHAGQRILFLGREIGNARSTSHATSINAIRSRHNRHRYRQEHIPPGGPRSGSSPRVCQSRCPRPNRPLHRSGPPETSADGARSQHVIEADLLVPTIEISDPAAANAVSAVDRRNTRQRARRRREFLRCGPFWLSQHRQFWHTAKLLFQMVGALFRLITIHLIAVRSCPLLRAGAPVTR